MKKVSLLDCTLRDGGYINDWNFGKQTILNTFIRLNNSGVEYIEIGFLDDKTCFDENRSIQPATWCYDKIFEGIKTKKATVVAMIDFGHCKIENIADKNNSFIDAIRIIFKKPKMKEAVEFAKQVKNKGYKVFLQLVSITAYNDVDLLNFVSLANALIPFAVSIVDTYGLMHKEKMFHYFDLLDSNLNKNITIGFHSHNNFQLAYANAIELLKRESFHDILLDGTAFGMGKNAGNAPIELLCMFLNEHYNKKYNINDILEIIDLTILKIFSKTPWGYSLPLFLSSSNACHPSYIKTLMKKNTLSISSINQIVKKLKGDDKLNYNEMVIEKLYQNYQKTVLKDKNKQELISQLNNKELLLIGPGMSVALEKEKIDKFIANSNPVVVSINCVTNFKQNFMFVSNSKRFEMIANAFELDKNIKIIATSNISSAKKDFDYVLNFEKLTNKNKQIFDNSLLMFLNFLSKTNVKKITLAGFDGFSKNNINYFNDYFEFSADIETLEQTNVLIKDAINNLKKSVKIEFLTKSIYNKK